MSEIERLKERIIELEAEVKRYKQIVHVVDNTTGYYLEIISDGNGKIKLEEIRVK